VKPVDRERSEVNEIAKDYEERGYHVRFNPSLGSVKADLIATNERETVVIEVKVGNDRDARARLPELARFVAQRPGWRFEFVSVADDDRLSTPPEADVISRHAALQRLELAKSLLNSGAPAAANVVLWMGATRLLLDRLDESETLRPNLSPSYLVKAMYSRGFINRTQFTALARSADARNAAAHGVPARVTRRDVERWLRLVREVTEPERANRPGPPIS